LMARHLEEKSSYAGTHLSEIPETRQAVGETRN
jgi:hypothetical protein